MSMLRQDADRGEQTERQTNYVKGLRRDGQFLVGSIAIAHREVRGMAQLKAASYGHSNFEFCLIPMSV